MAGGDLAVALDPGPDPHEDGVAAPVGVEDLLAGQGDLHRAPGQHRELGRADLVTEGIALSAKPSTDRGGDHPDPPHRKAEHFAQGPVDVMRRLGRGPEHEAPAGLDLGDRAVLLHRQVGIPLKEEHVFAHVVRLGEPPVGIAELQRDVLVDIGGRSVPVLLHPDLGFPERVLDRHDRPKRLVLHLDRLAGPFGGLLVHRRHGGDRIADVPDLVEAQRLLVLAARHDPELRGEIATGEDGVHAGECPRPGHVQPDDPRVGEVAAEELAVQHPREEQIVCVPGLAGRLGRAVDLGPRPADDPQPAVSVHRRPPSCAWPVPRIRAAANSTASRILR